MALAVSGFGPIPVRIRPFQLWIVTYTCIQVVIARLTDIVTTVGSTIQQLAGTQPFTVKSDEDAIVNSLTTVNSYPNSHTNAYALIIISHSLSKSTKLY